MLSYILTLPYRLASRGSMATPGQSYNLASAYFKFQVCFIGHAYIESRSCLDVEARQEIRMTGKKEAEANTKLKRDI